MSITDEELLARTQALIDEVDPKTADQFAFRGAQYDHGLAWVHFPEGKGGLGLSPGRQRIVNEALREAGAPWHDLLVNPIGIGMGAPTVLTYGTEEMHDKYLKRIFTGEDIWCQLFSEPGHGSDVAGLAGRGIRDGDEWVVNGQKVWTTLAHLSNFGMLLVRTNPDAPKHKGMTYFVVDMHSPGVEVKPLYQITGEAEFNEVFFTDVRVPHANMLGDEGEGWRVALTTLMNERVALGGGTMPKGKGPISRLISTWTKRQDRLDPIEHAVWQDTVTQLWIEAEVLRLTTIRARATAKAGNPGPEGSIRKLASAELNQRIFNACVDLDGTDGMLLTEGYPMTRPGEDGETRVMHSSEWEMLRARANTIEGGTSEIMRNILGERVLGLPGEPRVDKNLPWKEIPK
jgi:alkylation response protein AidB-like acyl-CoA dehydrogenase